MVCQNRDVPAPRSLPSARSGSGWTAGFTHQNPLTADTTSTPGDDSARPLRSLGGYPPMSEPPAAAPPAVRASRHRAPRCAHLARRLPRARPGGPGHPRDAPRPASHTRATSARRDSSATTHAPRTTHRTPWNIHPTPPAHLPPGMDPRFTHRVEVGPGRVSWPADVTRADTARSAARSGRFDEHARTGFRSTERPQKHNNTKGIPRESPAANRHRRTTASDRPVPLARAPRGTFSAYLPAPCAKFCSAIHGASRTMLSALPVPTVRRRVGRPHPIVAG